MKKRTRKRAHQQAKSWQVELTYDAAENSFWDVDALIYGAVGYSDGSGMDLILSQRDNVWYRTRLGAAQKLQQQLFDLLKRRLRGNYSIQIKRWR